MAFEGMLGVSIWMGICGQCVAMKIDFGNHESGCL